MSPSGLQMGPVPGGGVEASGVSFLVETPAEPAPSSGRVRTSCRPTLRAVLAFLPCVPLALLLVTTQPEAWYFALYPPLLILALIGVDFSLTLPGRRLGAELKIPGRLPVGRTEALELSLQMGQWPRPVLVEAILELEGEVEPPTMVAGTSTGGQLLLKPTVTPRRRGRVGVPAFWLRWRSPLGMLELRRREEIQRNIDVIPDLRGLYHEALHFFANDAAIGLKSQRLRGEGAEFDKLCDYAAGMDSRFIDWKRSAHHRKLLCKEFRQERNHQIVLGFDTGHLMLEPVEGLPKLDHAIQAGLLLGWVSLYHGDLLGGCGFDGRFRNFIKPGRGLPYFSQFQRFTAALAYRTEETNFTLGLAELNARLQRRALVVLFTEFVDTISAELLIESLQLMVRRYLVVFVTFRDPLLTSLRAARPDRFAKVAEAVLADDFERERSIVLERVARLGVHCLDVPARGLSSELLNRYLLIKQRGLL